MSHRGDRVGQSDPRIERHIEREYKISHYDIMRSHRAGLAGFVVGLLLGLALQVINR